MIEFFKEHPPVNSAYIWLPLVFEDAKQVMEPADRS
jgi:hypothetical protein